MKTVELQKCLVSGLIFFLAATGMVGTAFSDHDDHRYYKRDPCRI